MNLIDVTSEQVEEAYRRNNLLPLSRRVRPLEDGRCCAIGALAFDNKLEAADFRLRKLHEIARLAGLSTEIKDGEPVDFAVGFDDGFDGVEPDLKHKRALYSKGFAVGQHIKKAFT